MDEKANPNAASESEFITPKLEADKLMQELMMSSQKALIDMMRKSGVSNEALDELKKDLNTQDESLPMTEDVSWNEYLMSSEEQKNRITQASQQALHDFQEQVGKTPINDLTPAKVPNTEPAAPNMELLMSGLSATQPDTADE